MRTRPDSRAVADQRLDEVAGPDVVREVGEQMTAERVVAEVLDESASVGVRARFAQLLLTEAAESLLQQSGDFMVPGRVNGTQERQL